MAERDSVAKALGVAAGVAFFCSLFVSSAVLWLRPIQLAYQSIERNRAVLEAAGIVVAGVELAESEIVDRFLDLDVRIVNLDDGAFSDAVSPIAYDFRSAIDDPDQTVAVPGGLDIAALGRRPALLPAYLAIDGSRIEQIVLPVYGRGMWSTIHGFISLRGDFATIEGAAFYEHGETPGIGDRIQDAAWLAQWRGQRAYDDSGRLVFGIGAAGTARDEGIDAITGATVTVAAVENLVRYWLGENGFGPFLTAMRSEAQ
ncbi:MAG TPA: NADH:ubiquinone reductase (Na(+)-transporting) subunit C [Gammaproteobacteria bacterium]